MSNVWVGQFNFQQMSRIHQAWESTECFVDARTNSSRQQSKTWKEDYTMCVWTDSCFASALVSYACKKLVWRRYKNTEAFTRILADSLLMLERAGQSECWKASTESRGVPSSRRHISSASDSAWSLRRVWEARGQVLMLPRLPRFSIEIMLWGVIKS